MRCFWTVLTAAVLLGNLAYARADEQKLSPGKLPKAVTRAVKERFPGAKVVGASKETEEGKTLYEVSLVHKGQKIDVTLSTKGKIQGIEQEISAKKLPKAVTQTLSRFADARIRKAEAITEVEDGNEELEAYEVVLSLGKGGVFEIVLSPAGKITKIESKGKGGEEKEAKEDHDEKERKSKNIKKSDDDEREGKGKKAKRDEDDDEKEHEGKKAKREKKDDDDK